MINKFDMFIEESYLDSNYAPLYHFTTEWSLESILEDNILKTGWIENPFFKVKQKIVSFTRNKDLKMTHYKSDLNTFLCIDTNKLIIDGYKLYPYDYFIQNKKESLPKSNINRSEPFEFEEASKKNILNLDKYLISVTFLDDSIYSSYRTINILKSKNIPTYENNRRIF